MTSSDYCLQQLYCDALFQLFVLPLCSQDTAVIAVKTCLCGLSSKELQMSDIEVCLLLW